jgi:anaerobic selenocysteine-containing dehydrogenase
MRTEVPTYCRICEASCGLIATVEDDHIVDVRSDREHVHSRGFSCTKPKAMLDIVADPDRLLTPMKRVGGPGEFQAVSWEEALSDIAERLGRIIERDGPSALATFTGNPATFSTAGTMALDAFRNAIGSPWSYGVNGEDGAAFVAAMEILFGSASRNVRPDLWRTDFLLMVGANPWVSKGSGVSEPRFRDAMGSIVERGGRVVVVDPRATETAKNFEHVALRPGTDPYLFLAMIKVIVEEDLYDHDAVAARTTGFAELAAMAQRFDIEFCAEKCGIPADVIVQLARDLANAESTTIYGRTGSCTQRFGTLTNLLMHTIVTITGNLNRRGGTLFGWGAIDPATVFDTTGPKKYGALRSRTSGLPAVFGLLPSQPLWRDITEPGDGQIRALVTYSANPVHASGAGGKRLIDALETLELHFSLDLYMNETNRHAHYILPAPTFYERPDLPMFAMASMLRPTAFATRQVISPRGDVRHEADVLRSLAERLGLGGSFPAGDLLDLADQVLRTGAAGDHFGARSDGVSFQRLVEDHPHGAIVADELPIQDLDTFLATEDRRVHIATPEFLSEVERLRTWEDDNAFPLRAIGMRELRSHNTWMHNSPRLMGRNRQPAVLVHPSDAAGAGVVDGGLVEIESAQGTVVMAARLTDDVMEGTVAIPHGWGHEGGWKLANAAGGANSNDLTSARDEDIERLAGMSILNGIPVRIRGARADVSTTTASAVP